MMSIDERLAAMLDDLQFTSRLKTSVCIQLADYAAQLFGYRSTRQVNDKDSDKVEDSYNELLIRLLNISYECKQLIENNHLNYRDELLDLDDDALSSIVEEALFKAVIFDDYKIFIDSFT